MIEATDASKCDERQVKNKSNPLTHKSKGETHTMSNQGMKIWKLGAFFVVSLMLVVGVFADTAQGQSARITVTTSPRLVKAEGTLKTVTVRYVVTSAGTIVETVDGDTAADIDGNAVQITLPATWGPAYPTTGTKEFETVAGVPTADAAIKSYVVVMDSLATDPTITQVVPSTGQITVTGDMRRGNSITVIYHNVMVRSFTDDELKGIISGVDDAETATFTMAQQDRLKMGLPVMVTDGIQVSVTNSDSNIDATDDVTETGSKNIKITGPKPSIVTISDSSFKAEELISALTVTYRVTEDIALDDDSDNNTITIQLPADWKAAYPPSTDTTGIGDESFGTTVLAKAPDLSALPAGEMRSYAVLQSPYLTAADAAAAATNTLPTLAVPDFTTGTPGPGEVSLAVTGITDGTKMAAGNTITLTYYNVRVQSLTEPELAADDPVKTQLGVYDTKVGLQHTDTTAGAQIYSLAYMSSGEITVSPPAKSRVEVVTAPRVVKSEAVLKSVRVRYTTRDTVYGGNIITIQLPADWKPAYRASDSDADEATMSFGLTALSNSPSVNANTTSYVVLKSNRDNIGMSDGSNFVIYQQEMNAELLITVEGMMPAGNTIEAAFYGVMVPESMDNEAVTAKFTVTDSKISPDGSAYETETMITVAPRDKSRVLVSTTPTTVRAEAVLSTVSVAYTVRDMVSNSNLITVELPDIYNQPSPPAQAWEAAFNHTFAPGSVDKISLTRDATATLPVVPVILVSSLPENAEEDENSYVTVVYRSTGSDRTNTAMVSIAGMWLQLM